MTVEATAIMGSASIQGQLWSARPRDWADIQEWMVRPLHESAFRKLDIGSGTRLLDVGCGAGGFCRLAADAGAEVHGFDAAPGLIEIAQQRTPTGDFQVGEMEALPFDDGAFDVVTGFNSFQFAASPQRALSEAARVTKLGGRVLIATLGKKEDCESVDFMLCVGQFLPPPPPGAPGPFALSRDGALEFLASGAGLRPEEVVQVDCPFDYPDAETALRGDLSAGPSQRAIQAVGEARVRSAILQAIAPYRTPSGGYLMRNKVMYLVARR
jgi:SAM-dependent methyltransferase